jgi:chromatin remodeling complex protein RSC6
MRAAEVLGLKEDSHIGVIQALWNYIKVHGLQDKVDRRLVRADEYLRPVSAHARVSELTMLTH